VHIPDGMLEARTWIPAWLGSAGVLAWALRRLKQTLSEGGIVLMAVMAALIFALQMLNFPVAGGTSGHFAGGAAAAIVLGLWPAMAVMAAVVTIQAVFFADGGITALGANLLTMAIVGPLVGAVLHRAVSRLSEARPVRLAAAFSAAWTACVASALVAGVLLWLSGRAPLGTALLAMGGWHALIGIGEGAITAGLVGYLLAVRPDLLASQTSADRTAVRGAAIGLGALALAAVGLSFFASSDPDGLEYAYERIGTAFEPFSVLTSPLSDYVVPGVSNDALAGILAGLVGALVAGMLAWSLLRTLRAKGTKDPK